MNQQQDNALAMHGLEPQRVPPVVHEELETQEREALQQRIKRLLKIQDAVLIAHYYTHPDLQRLAEQSGGYVSDSLDMARFGHESSARTLVVGGVRFMGETAKLLNPEKRVLMPDLRAECSLDTGCPPDAFEAFRRQHPDRTVVVYANTSAAVKAQADWMVTSGTALDVVRYLHERGEPILWAPDRFLGSYVQQHTGADMLLWNSACIVHEEFKGHELVQMRREYPQAVVLVHPESPASVIEQADHVGSTTELIQAVHKTSADTYIVATDQGILYKMRQAAPGKKFLAAPTSGKGATCRSCAYCPWMAMNYLSRLAHVLETGENETHVDAALCERAMRPIQRLLDFCAQRKQCIYGLNDA